MGWPWHQLGHMQIICTSLQTDTHASTSSLKFLQAGCFFWRSTRPLTSSKHWSNNYFITDSVGNPCVLYTFADQLRDRECVFVVLCRHHRIRDFFTGCSEYHSVAATCWLLMHSYIRKLYVSGSRPFLCSVHSFCLCQNVILPFLDCLIQKLQHWTCKDIVLFLKVSICMTNCNSCIWNLRYFS